MTVRPLSYPADLPELDRLFELCRSHDGHHPLSEHKYASLTGRPQTGAGFVAVCRGSVVGYVHILESRRPGTFELETAVDPARRDETDMVLLHAALDHVRRVGGQELLAWVYRPGGARLLEDLGFELARSLHQLRVPLPAESPGFNPEIEFRGYRPLDEAALLDLNNRAFEGHLETGNWSARDLHLRQEFEWYHPDGIRMAWKDECLVAFCWTKVHPDGLGEIYLIAADPQHRGKGYGKAVTLEGLRFLTDHEGSSTGMLYVDDANQRAMSLYARLGFTKHHTDFAFRLRL